MKSFFPDLKRIIRSRLMVCQSWDPTKMVDNQIRDGSGVLRPMTSHTERHRDTRHTNWDREQNDTQTLRDTQTHSKLISLGRKSATQNTKGYIMTSLGENYPLSIIPLSKYFPSMHSTSSGRRINVENGSRRRAQIFDVQPTSNFRRLFDVD